MQQHDITGQRACELLVQASQDANIKLTDVATWLVTEHEQPGQARNT